MTVASMARRPSLSSDWEVKRGPWGYIIYKPGTADLEIDSLIELPAALNTLQAD